MVPTVPCGASPKVGRGNSGPRSSPLRGRERVGTYGGGSSSPSPPRRRHASGFAEKGFAEKGMKLLLSTGSRQDVSRLRDGERATHSPAFDIAPAVSHCRSATSGPSPPCVPAGRLRAPVAPDAPSTFQFARSSLPGGQMGRDARAAIPEPSRGSVRRALAIGESLVRSAGSARHWRPGSAPRPP